MTIEETELSKFIVCLNDWGASDIKHSGRTFLDHHVGTYKITSNWKLAKRVRLAALFHSVYGIASIENSRTYVTREQLYEKIGCDAEQLVWSFYSLDRLSFFKNLQMNRNKLNMNNQLFNDVVHLLAANQIEQFYHKPELAHPARIGPILSLVPFLSPKPRADILNFLSKNILNDD